MMTFKSLALAASLMLFLPAALPAQNNREVDALMLAAKRGDTDARMRLGERHLYGEGVVQSRIWAREWLRPLAQQGHIPAKYLLEQHVMEEPSLSLRELLELTEAAAQLGIPDAQFELARRHESGEVASNEAAQRQAIDWYEKAAAQGHSPSVYQLALYHETGHLVSEDKEKARFFNERKKELYPSREIAALVPKAREGDMLAQYQLARLYSESGLAEIEPAKDWFLLAAEQGHPEAMLQTIARISMDKPYAQEQAIGWYKKAARLGNSEALGMLLEQYQNNSQNNSSKLLDHLASNLAHADADDQYLLAIMYSQGFAGIPLNPDEAMNWFRRAAEQGHADAQKQLADAYNLGIGIEQNDALALEWYHRAAEQGHPEAQYQMGHASSVGANGQTIAPEKSSQWFTRAAQRGHAEAQYMLGRAYQTGFGVAQDNILAIYWYEQAAIQKHIPALQLIGELYEDGDILVQDHKQALRFYSEALQQNSHLPTLFAIARMYQHGQGFEKRMNDAAEIFEKIKNEYSVSDIEEQATMYELGIGHRKNASRASGLYQLACEAGSKASCNAVQRLACKQ
ncbi:hypothetical protein CO613_03240 [Lysobacteraceae bacterium NML07-0707]|nr:hypothetical protein CO613_03240 [Xanthomonadaceae bacterium NML07-0707]